MTKISFVKAHAKEWLKFNLLTFQLVAAFYIPYQVFFIGLTPFQLVKWVTTSGFYSAIFNLLLQPWLAFLHRRRWLK